MKKETNVRITWSEAIEVALFKNEDFSLQEETVVQQEGVVYIFVGKDENEKIGVDVGQTGRSLLKRVKEHIEEQDYLEGFPKEQKVFSGKISSQIDVNNDLLKQTESIIIQHLIQKSASDEFGVCNISQTKHYDEIFNIGHIENCFIPRELSTFVDKYIPEEDDANKRKH